MSRRYPDSVAGPYEPPPKTFTDAHGHRIRVEHYDGEFDALVEMYLQFDPEDRAQGIPPTGEDRIRTWLETLLNDGCVNVVAKHDDGPVGHATLVPDDDGTYELAIFVLREYQGAGVGTELIKSLLAAGRESGIETVWLTVERWNNAAIALYKNVGFEPSDTNSFELEMAARLE